MVFQGYKMLWGRGAQRKTITCLQTCTHPSLRGRPAMWITSVVFQGRRNLRDVWFTSKFRSIYRKMVTVQCRFSSEMRLCSHCWALQPGCSWNPRSDPSGPGLKAAETQSPCPIPYSGFTTGEPPGIPLRKWLAGRSDLWITAGRTDDDCWSHWSNSI